MAKFLHGLLTATAACGGGCASPPLPDVTCGRGGPSPTGVVVMIFDESLLDDGGSPSSRRLFLRSGSVVGVVETSQSPTTCKTRSDSRQERGFIES